MTKRTQPFEIRKEQYWAASNDTKKPKFIVGQVLHTKKGGEVQVFDLLAKTFTTVTVSKDTLLEQYKYIPKRGADIIVDKGKTGGETAARDAARTIGAILIPKGKQADLPFKALPPPVVGTTKMPTPPAPKKDVAKEALEALGAQPKPEDVFKKSVAPWEIPLLMTAKRVVSLALKVINFALGEKA